MSTTAAQEASNQTIEFVQQHNIDVTADAALLGAQVIPELVQFEHGETARHITETGANYDFSRLNYYRRDDLTLAAHRMIAVIQAGDLEAVEFNRTELAYWSRLAQPKELTVHQGVGILEIGVPDDDPITRNVITKPKKDAPAHNTFGLRGNHLHPSITPQVTLPPGRFYTIKSALWTPEPLVVSGLYREEQEGSGLAFEELETHFDPGTTSVEAPEGTIPLPSDFAASYAARLIIPSGFHPNGTK